MIFQPDTTNSQQEIKQQNFKMMDMKVDPGGG